MIRVIKLNSDSRDGVFMGATSSFTFSIMTNNQPELDLAQLHSISGGAAANNDFCIDPLVLMWKLRNPGKDLPKWLGGKTGMSSKF